jgi:hypothetical protein
MLLAEHGLDQAGVRGQVIPSAQCTEIVQTDVQRVRPIAAPTGTFLSPRAFCSSTMFQTGVYFTEVESTNGSKYVPRSIQVDLESGVCDRVCRTSFRMSEYTKVPPSFVADRLAHCFARTHIYTGRLVRETSGRRDVSILTSSLIRYQSNHVVYTEGKVAWLGVNSIILSVNRC